MTDYIEEMMKTAKVEADSCCAPIGADCSKGCDNCQRNNITCPTFTPAKQLEIIKLIATNKISEDYRNMAFDRDEIDNKWYFYLNVNEKINAYKAVNKDFTRALAQLTTELMKAGELDKDKVKEILEK